MSFAKLVQAALLLLVGLALNSLRSVRSVSLLVTLLIVLAAAQSNPVAQAHQPSALPGAQQPPAGTFQPPPVHFKDVAIYNSGGLYANSVAIGDLNLDGKPDLVVTNPCPCNGTDHGVIGVLLGNGDGTFQQPINYDPGGLGPSAVVIGDVNGDGKPDLVIATLCQTSSFCGDPYAGGVSVLLGNGDGTFQPAVVYSSGGYSRASPSFVVINDVNGDGKPDLIVSSECQSGNNCNYPTGPGGVTVLLGNGDGTFQPAASYSSGGWRATSVAVSDLNGDGTPDLVVSNFCLSGNNCDPFANDPGGVSVLLGNGDGTFQPPVSFSSSGYFAYWVAIGDVNGDGHPDLIVVNGCGNNNCAANLAVFLGNGDGTFQNPANYDGPFGATSVAIGDVNGDGNLDLVVSSSGCFSCRDSVSVLPGKGDGTFQPPVNFYAGGYLRASLVAIGDVNRDGKPDLVVANACSVNDKFGPCPTNHTVGVLVNNFTAYTATTLTSSPNPSHVNQSVTFIATVTSSTSVPPNGSTVIFYDHLTVLGKGTTTNGVASFTTSFSKPETKTYKAVYPGDVFHHSSSGRTTQVVTP